MATVDVVTGNDVLASEYNLLRSEVIAAATVGGVNAEDIVTTIAAASVAGVDATAAAADVVTHAGVTANIHGLPSGIDVLGVQTPGQHIQYIAVNATVHHSDGGNSETNYISGEWVSGFTTIVAAVVACGKAHSWDSGAGHLENIRHIEFSVTGVTIAVRTYQSATTDGQIGLWAMGMGT